MSTQMKILIQLFVLFLFLNSSVLAEKITVFEFTEEEMATLKEKKVKGKTKWKLGANANGNFIRAEAEGTGSGLGKELKINLNKTPYINITWKVEKDYRG